MRVAAVAAGVYPRVCGGTLGLMIVSLALWGLSPRVRGNRATAGRLAMYQRSIPACAGEPSGIWPPAATPWVYPRVCGGTPLLPTPELAQKGLSPRVRGNR